MNVFGKNERSWRKARKRGVSPIIATILLVAITVVLAAVLYVLISGLTHGVGSAPLAWGWGSPTNATGVSGVVGCTSGIAITAKFCYTVTISPGSGITPSNVLLSLRSAASGATVAWPLAASTAISVLSPTTPGIIAEYCLSATTEVTGLTCTAASTWATAAAFSGTFAGGMTIVVAIAGGQASGNTGGLLGIELEAVGQSGYSGTQASSPFA
jgi:flagellin-like protein